MLAILPCLKEHKEFVSEQCFGQNRCFEQEQVLTKASEASFWVERAVR